jgi:hypothetical protein
MSWTLKVRCDGCSKAGLSERIEMRGVLDWGKEWRVFVVLGRAISYGFGDPVLDPGFEM